MNPMTAAARLPTIRPTMGRNVTPAKFTSELAQRLRAARVFAGYATQKEAARALGVGLDSYETWERGRTPIPAQHVLVVCEKFNCDANYLFGTEPRRPQMRPAEAQRGTGR